MKKWTSVETKHGVIIAWQDADTQRHDSIRMTYQEAWGLLHALEELRDNPEFKNREPRQRHFTTNGNKKVVKTIEYEGSDD